MKVFEHDFRRFPELTNAQLELLRFVSPHVQIEEDFVATVVKVHDGDTVTLRASFRDFDFPLRLLDIDAPELSEGGEEAREWLSSIVLGREVMVLIDSANRVEKYGRLLGRVFVDGLDVGESAVLLGVAKPFGLRREDAVPELGKILLEASV